MNADESLTVKDALNIARRVLVQHHDVVDVGDDDRPKQGPNWAMRATNAIDEAMEVIREA